MNSINAGCVHSTRRALIARPHNIILLPRLLGRSEPVGTTQNEQLALARQYFHCGLILSRYYLSVTLFWK